MSEKEKLATNLPTRIQRKRTRGWRMPSNAVSITRPGRFGNPYYVGYTVKGSDFVIHSIDEALVFFRHYAEARLRQEQSWLDDLKGKALACWCPVPGARQSMTNPIVFYCSVCDYSFPSKTVVAEHIECTPHCHGDIILSLLYPQSI